MTLVLREPDRESFELAPYVRFAAAQAAGEGAQGRYPVINRGKSMNKSLRQAVLAGAILLALGGSAASAADLYYQTFNIGLETSPPGCNINDYSGGPGTYPFPADWLRFNVDGKTPASSVSYVNNAWIAREDFGRDVSQCAAFSTSWYVPAGQANDWMWSPAIAIPAGGASLGWRAVAYDADYRDGYEVRIKTGDAPSLANQAASTVIHSTPAENAEWTSYAEDLSAYAGQTVYVGFRNNSNDKFLLVIDDVRVSSLVPDLAVQAPAWPYTTEYARAPLGMEIVPTLAVTALNAGGVSLTNVVGVAEPLRDDTAAGPFVTATTPPTTLAPAASVELTFNTPAAYSGAGVWATKYTLTADQSATDENPVNDTIEIPGVTIGGNELARWEGTPTGTLGIGAGNGGELGVAFTIPTGGWYAGAHFGMQAIPPETDGSPNSCPGLNYVLNLREFDAVSSKPGAIITTTEPVACEYDVSYSVDVAFEGGTRWLPAGTYVLTAVEPIGSTMRLFMHEQRFVTGSTWANWPTNPGGWVHLEQIGAAFTKTPQLSLLAGEEPEQPIFADGFDGMVPRPAQWHRTDKPASVVVPRPSRKPLPTRLIDAGVR